MLKRATAAAAAAMLTCSVAPALAGPGKTDPMTPTSATATTPAVATLPPGQPITFYFGLRRRDGAAHHAFVRRSQPGASDFRRWLSPRGLARRFGATPTTRHGVREGFAQLGFATSIDPARTYASVTGIAQQWQGLGATLKYRAHSTDDDVAGTSISAKGATLPRSLTRHLREQIWRTNTSEELPASTVTAAAAAPRLARLDRPRKTPVPGNNGTWVGACRAARHTHPQPYSYGQVAHAYGAHLRSHARIGILTFGTGVDAASTRVAERCWQWPRQETRIVLAPGQSQHAAGSYGQEGEAQLDLQTVRGFVPRAHVTNYQGWVSPSSWFLTASRALADVHRPPVMSMSFDECEERTGRQTRSLFDAQAARLGLLGTTFLVASGDLGSWECGKKTVVWPASSPYVTAVGGTRLAVDRRNQRVSEVTWNDFPYQHSIEPGTSGGGFSRLYRRPRWQRGSAMGGQGRMLPDVASHASRAPSLPTVIRMPRQTFWTPGAGTSAATPSVAAHVAVLSHRLAARGKPLVGPLAPQLFWSYPRHRDWLFDVTRGGNRVPGVSRGYRALPGYDLVTGLGAPQYREMFRGLASLQ